MQANSNVPVPPGSDPSDRNREIGRLFEEHNRGLIQFLTARLRSEADAREVAQEAYVRLLQLDDSRTIGFLRAYLFRIATNLATDRLRARSVRDAVATMEPAEDLMHEFSPERVVQARQELEQVQSSLPELPAKCRQVFLLHTVEGLSTEEIGKRLGLSRRMARLHVVRALVFLRGRLDRDPET